MKQFLSMLLCAVLLCGCCCAFADIDYTVAEKFIYQLQAPSGFQGELILDYQNGVGQSYLKEPLNFRLNYLQKPSSNETRAELSLVKEESVLSCLNLRLAGDEIDLQADVLSPDWFCLKGDSAALLSQAAAQSTAGSGSLLGLTGTPALAALCLKLIPSLTDSALEELTEDLTTRVDLWIEGYRDEPVLEDGLILIRYRVPAAALKAEIKTLLLDLLENEEQRTLLSSALGDSAAKLYLSPEYREVYFEAVDALPLGNAMSLERVVSTKGQTRSLCLTLPLYDPSAGNLQLVYERRAADGDIPEEESLSLYGDQLETEIIFNRYTTEEGLRVWSGNLRSKDGESSRELEFSLNYQQKNSTLSDGRESTQLLGAVSLQPGQGCTYLTKPLEASFDMSFTSPTGKKASTHLSAAFSLSPEGEDCFVLTLEGDTVKEWSFSTFREQTTDVSTLSVSELLGLFGGLAENTAELLKKYLPDTLEELPAGEAATEEVETPAEEAAAEETETPAEEAASEEAESPAGEAASEETETPAEEVATEEAESPAEEAATEEAESPAEEAATEETETPAEEATSEEVETLAGEAATEEAESPAEEAATEEAVSPAGETPSGETSY